MTELSNYQANIIRTIYGHGTYIENEDFVTNKEVLDFYQKNMNFNNSIEIPSNMKVMCKGHALSKYSLEGERQEIYVNEVDDNEDNLSNLDNINNRIEIHPDIVSENKHYYKLLNEKEINWENAYLPNLHFEGFDLNNIDYKEFEIDKSNINNPILNVTSAPTKSYHFDNNLPNNINNTYDLIQIINYLLLRIKALKFLLRTIVKQKNTIQEYNKLKDNA